MSNENDLWEPYPDIDRDVDDDECWIPLECPYCNDGWQCADGIAIECPECGGTGWY